MNFFELLKSLKFKSLFSLIKLSAGNILMIYPTIKATIKCMKITEKLYPIIHHQNNSANAFRHALWNMLLVNEMLKWNKDLLWSMEWAKKVTDWHEDFSPNSLLAKEMDLHNNKIGRTFFKSLFFKEAISEKIIISELQDKVKKSKKITSIDELEEHESSLVFLES